MMSISLSNWLRYFYKTEPIQADGLESLYAFLSLHWRRPKEIENYFSKGLIWSISPKDYDFKVKLYINQYTATILRNPEFYLIHIARNKLYKSDGTKAKNFARISRFEWRYNWRPSCSPCCCSPHGSSILKQNSCGLNMTATLTATSTSKGKGYNVVAW